MPAESPHSRLDEVVSRIVGGGTPSRQIASYWSGAIPWASVKDLTDEQVELSSTQESISEAGLRASASNLVEPGTIVVATRMGVGRAAIASRRVAINQDLKGLIISADRADSRYVLHQLKRLRPLLESQAVGSTVLGLSTQALLDAALFLPPLAEQRRIAEILDTLDEAIQKTAQLIAKLKQTKQGLLHDLLTRGIDENGELRDPERHPELFKETVLGRLPADWETSPISSLLADVDPAMRSGPFGSALLSSELVAKGVPLLGIDNVHVERFDATYTRFVSPTKAAALARYRVRPKDLMITIMGTVGRCCVVPDDIGEALSSKHVWTLSLDPSTYSSTLACLQVNHSPWVKRHFARDEQGGIMSAIRSDTLRSTILPVPPITEAKRIEAVMTEIANRIRAEQDAQSKMLLLKQGLMEDLLTGRVRVTTPFDEVAA